MFVDTHCHLCPGLDDGPATMDEAIKMCQIAWNEGIRKIACTAHQNAFWPNVTPQAIMSAADDVSAELQRLGCDIELVPTAEVVVEADLIQRWENGELLSIGNQGKYLLIEMPHGVFLDLREMVSALVLHGIRPILAHVERYPELLWDQQHTEDLMEAGCVMQLSAGAITSKRDRRTTKILRRWAHQGWIHVIGTDAHSPRGRAPRMLSAFDTFRQWTSDAMAERVFVENGLAVLNSEDLNALPAIPPRKRTWLFSS